VDLERPAERDLVRPGRLHASPAGLHDAVGAGLAAGLIAAGLVRDRVEGDGMLGAGQVRHPVDDGGHADHGYPEDQHHPDPAEKPQDPVLGRVVVGALAAAVLRGERGGLRPDRGRPAPQQRGVHSHPRESDDGQGAYRDDDVREPRWRRRPLRRRVGVGAVAQRGSDEADSGQPGPAVAAMHQLHRGSYIRGGGGAARLERRRHHDGWPAGGRWNKIVITTAAWTGARPRARAGWAPGRRRAGQPAHAR
jgi:hypothetical protein